MFYVKCSYLDAVQNGEPTGVLLRMAKDVDAAPALLARNVLEKYCMRDNANGIVSTYLTKVRMGEIK